ncbi:MAG: hypothetical protein IKP31_02435 [Lachnospiraceae bacterium]|nr:hypothetical protein [Lachnospiraceae bacterium]
MRLFNIKNTGLFMTGLLSEKETAFDQFLLYEAVIAMGNTYTIDGHINKAFYSADEIEILRQQASDNGRIFSEEMIRWEAAKNFCFEFIKGKKAPLSFKVTLCLAPENINRFLAGMDTHINCEQINSLNVNIRFDGSTLTCTTAVSLKIFSMDKSFENSWDKMFERFLNAHGYEFE